MLHENVKLYFKAEV